MIRYRFLFKNLNEGAKKRIQQRAYRIFSQIWIGYSLKQFESYFFPDEDENLHVTLFFDHHQCIGYCIQNLTPTTVGRSQINLMRVSANVLPEYIGWSLTAQEVFSVGLHFFFQSLWEKRKLILFMTANSPLSYAALVHRTLVAYPTPRKQTPQFYHQLMLEISRQHGLKLSNEYPLICRFSGIRLARDSLDLMESKNSYPIRFFKTFCPDYHKGEALVVAVPLTIGRGLIEISHQIIRWPLRVLKTRLARISFHQHHDAEQTVPKGT